MAITAKDVLKSFSGRTNINNVNNNNNDNNIITSIIVPIGSNAEIDLSNGKASPSLLASSSTEGRPLGQNELPAREIGYLPPTWKSVKIDLFQNGTNKSGRAQLTLKMGIIPKGQTKPVALTAQLNSPIRHIYRKVDKGDLLINPHWIRVKAYDKANRSNISDLRASKFYIDMKSGSVEEMVVFLYPIQHCWCMELIKSGELYQFVIDDEGSQNFRNVNGIATAFYGEKSNTIKWVSQKELGI